MKKKLFSAALLALLVLVGLWQSPQESGHVRGNIAHVMTHTRPAPDKPIHSQFTVTTRAEVVALLDEAWEKRTRPARVNRGQGRVIYEVKMGRVIGTRGEKRLRLVVDQDSGDIITAYPVK